MNLNRGRENLNWNHLLNFVRDMGRLVDKLSICVLLEKTVRGNKSEC